MRPWKTITYTCQDTRETREQIVAHDSVYESLRTKRQVVLRDKCPAEKSGAPSS